jgi:hypothetical protein
VSTTTLPAPAAAPGPGEDLRADITTVLEKLAALGTSDQIAAYFIEQGITAVCANAKQCVIAEHLRAQLGLPAIEVAVFTGEEDDQGGVQYGPGQYFPESGRYVEGPTVALPAVVCEFARRFDAGDFPALTRLA